jgi:hypothetical protein
MKIAALVAASALAFAATAPTLAIENYVGRFTTQALYDLCSDPNSRDKCNLYLQGLIYGLRAQRSMQEQGSGVCLPEMSPDAARLKILDLIRLTTRGKPSDNKDGGDWMALMGVAAGNMCKK